MPDAFAQLLDDHWEFTMRMDPVWATMTGDHRFDDRLPEASEASMAERLDGLQEFQRRLGTIDRLTLPASERLNYDILARALESDIRGIGFRTYRFPLAKVGGVHTFLPQLSELVPLETTRDLENYVSRLNQVRRHLDQQI
jgi:uncharacterized protein (DUF885 family)